MINGLYVGRALHFALGGRQQPVDGGLYETCTTVMPGDKFRLGERYLRKLALECERYPDVRGFTSGAQQAGDGHILEQGVPKRVDGVWWGAVTSDEADRE